MRTRISQKLWRLMRENNLSQSGLSRATGIPQPTINRILSEVTREPRRDAVIAIAKFFGIAPQSLFDDEISILKGEVTKMPLPELYARIDMLSENERLELFERMSKSY
tara:strand:+ start:2011 stop:2334 length:324 start_codon:yes stop_codon:yes gene_type:complete